MAFAPNDPKLAQTSDTMFSGYLEPELAEDYFKEAEKTSIIQSIARKVPLGPTGIKIPHWTGNVNAEWLGEAQMKPITKGNMTKQTIKPNKIATIFTESAEVVRANPQNYLGVMRTKIAEAIALAFDSAAMHGTNSPFGAYLDQSTKVRGLRPNPYDTLAVNGLGDLVEDRKKWTGTLLDDTVEPILNGAKDDNGRPLFIESTYAEASSPFRAGRIVARPTILSDHVREEGSDVVGYAGDFSQIIWGQVGGLSFDVTDKATLNFGTEQAPNLISLWQHNLIAVRVEAEYGLLVNDPQAFVKLTADVDIHTFNLDFNGATGGTATVTVNGKTSGTIAYNASAGTVKSAIVAVDDGLDADNVTVTGSAGDYTVTVPGSLTANGANLTGGSPAATATVTLV